MPDTTTTSRHALRQQLLQARQTWSGSPEAAAAQTRLEAHLHALLTELEPTCLGVYWPVRGELNPGRVALMMGRQMDLPLALPWAYKTRAEQASHMPHMNYHRWDGAKPNTLDECGIPSPNSSPVSPDVLLVPCVGFTRSGLRLGYGGGYFDRYLAAHPHVTAIGVAWSQALVDDTAFMPQPHDQPLMLIVTPEGVVGED